MWPIMAMQPLWFPTWFQNVGVVRWCLSLSSILKKPTTALICFCVHLQHTFHEASTSKYVALQIFFFQYMIPLLVDDDKENNPCDNIPNNTACLDVL
jgi:hypothetical protein